jgi:hypothetical protein
MLENALKFGNALRMATKKQQQNNYWQSCGKIGTLMHCW